ncbi:MAG: OmpA family protein [Proteobacteria bacterium]|nr:OmpA family protein [Pseudomonadota bacterium]
MRSLRLLAALVATFVVVSCGIPEEEYNAKLAQIEKLKGELSSTTAAALQLEEDLALLRNENQMLGARLAELGENVEKLLGEKSNMATDLAATREREAMLRAEQEAQSKRMAKYRQVIEKFQSLVSSGKLKIRVVRGRMVVEMASSILFPSGEAKLHEEGEIALAELAGILRTIKDRDFQVAGHTDNVPIRTRKFPSNWELSAARSVSVVKFLQESGVVPNHLSASGYAEYQPAADNNTEEGKAENRRIEIVLMPNLDELPDLTEIQGEIVKDKDKGKGK